MSDNVSAELEPVEQAAMIMLSLPEAQSARVMQRLSSLDIQRLTQKMATLKQVSSQDAQQVLQQFFTLYQQNAGIKKADRDSLARTLHDAVGATAAKSLIEQVYGHDVHDAVQRLEWIDDQLLADELSQEHHQMQANLLAMLSAQKSAIVLELLPAASHDDILYRIATMDQVNNAAVDEVEQLIERCILRSNQTKAPKVDGTQCVADIVNNFGGQKTALLKTLREHNHTVAQEVEAKMFDFIILGRQQDEVLQTLVAEIEMELMATALKGTDSSVRKAIMAALPKRMAQSLGNQITALGGIPNSQAEAARSEVMRMAKEMMDNGALDLQLFEDQVVE
ncbi:FliG C-terminal domain-containing protein [uncultured Ferrimonas sp.]|uniref:FliG C-terminal domain-containing protein n=1 Tax=uncultured Ferrimonas sp. TaxID=432640 RepID=UPI00260B8932|nr:FliG C-terminal domain-containing protein [uncultured Ferrimonas sp.]